LLIEPVLSNLHQLYMQEFKVPMKIISGLTTTALIFICGLALASYISMATEFSITASPAGLELLVASENRGDEPSYGVQFEVLAGNKQFTSAEVPRLNVNEKISEQFPVGDAFGLPGHYPIVIKTHYKDANAYPFSALTVGFYDHQEPVVSKILMRAENVHVPSNGSGTVNVVVRNNDSVTRDLEIVLHLPDELAAGSTQQSLQLAPGSEQTLHYLVENFSALEGSSYAIALIAQYEDSERHYSSSGSAEARITAASALSSRGMWVFGGAGSVVLILLILVMRKQRKRAHS
jgi:hypothetical protein